MPKNRRSSRITNTPRIQARAGTEPRPYDIFARAPRARISHFFTADFRNF